MTRLVSGAGPVEKGAAPAKSAAVLRMSAAFAAMAVGLVHLAIGATLGSAVTWALLVLGLVEIAWACAALRADAIPVPRLAIVGALAPMAVLALSLVTGVGTPWQFPVGPIVITSVLGWAVAMVLVLHVRAPRREARLGPGGSLAAIVVGALCVAAIVPASVVAIQSSQPGYIAVDAVHGH